jgi:hypothetical protein
VGGNEGRLVFLEMRLPIHQTEKARSPSIRVAEDGIGRGEGLSSSASDSLFKARDSHAFIRAGKPDSVVKSRSSPHLVE